jgi:hypothetical protein
MSRTRWILWVGVPLAVVAAVVAMFFLTGENPNVTHANFQRIHIGMPQDEVERILGKGAEITLGESEQYSASTYSYIGKLPEHNRILLWKRGMRSIVLYLQDGKVTGMRTSLKPGE